MECDRVRTVHSVADLGFNVSSCANDINDFLAERIDQIMIPAGITAHL